MPDRVVWNLLYPTFTPDEQAIFRHHFETLRTDPNVANVEATEHSDSPYLMTMRVEFLEGRDRPDAMELRHADSLFPTTANIERHIQIPQATPEQAREQLRRLRFEMPVITGISAQDAMERMQEVMAALRIPDVTTALNAIGGVIGGFTAPVQIPKWVEAGRAYRMKDNGMVVTLQRVLVKPERITVELIADGGATHGITLEEFVDLFEPYERPALPPSAWDRVLMDDED